MNQTILARVAPFAFYIIIMALTSVVSEWIADTRWLYGMRVIGSALILIHYWPKYHELGALTNLTHLKPAKIIQSILAGIIVFLLWINLDQGWMLLGEQTSYDPSHENANFSFSMMMIRIAGATLVVPLIEELFWRSFIMRWIDQADFDALSPAMVSIKALFLSSLIFAVEHHFWFAGLLAGLVYGLLYSRTRVLWYPVIAHAVTNGILGCWVIYTQQWQYW